MPIRRDVGVENLTFNTGCDGLRRAMGDSQLGGSRSEAQIQRPQRIAGEPRGGEELRIGPTDATPAELVSLDKGETFFRRRVLRAAYGAKVCEEARAWEDCRRRVHRSQPSVCRSPFAGAQAENPADRPGDAESKRTSRRESFATRFEASAGRNYQFRHRAAECREAFVCLRLDQAFQCQANERGLFLDSGGFAGFRQQIIVDV